MTPWLKFSQEGFRSLLESLPAGVYVVDRDRRIAFWSDGCERITGYRRHQVIGKACADNILMHCDEQHDVMCGESCPLLDTMRDGHPREADVFLRHSDGHRVPVRVLAVPVRDDHGAIVGACECFDERVSILPPARSARLVEIASSTDSVTQGPDRDALLRRLRDDLRELQSSHVPFGVLCLTLDNFDAVRAADGVNAVNKILRVTAETLVNAVGPDNVVGRWSEKSFVAILRGCTQAGLLESAVILKRLARLDAVPWWGDRLTITMSVGGTVARAEDTPEKLVARAEEALDVGVSFGENQATVV